MPRFEIPARVASTIFATAFVVTFVLVACSQSPAPTPQPTLAAEPGPPPTDPAPEPAAPPSAATPTVADASQARAYDDDPAAQKRGLDLFRAVCTGYCHSTSAQVERDAPFLFDCHWDHGSSDQEMFAVISNGIPDTQMQGFGGKLPDEDLWKLISFLRVRSQCEGGA